MARIIIISVKDSKVQELLEYFKTLDYVKVEKQEEEIVIHDWQKKILDERLKEIEPNPGSLVDQETLKNNIKRKYGY